MYRTSVLCCMNRSPTVREVTLLSTFQEHWDLKAVHSKHITAHNGLSNASSDSLTLNHYKRFTPTWYWKNILLVENSADHCKAILRLFRSIPATTFNIHQPSTDPFREATCESWPRHAMAGRIQKIEKKKFGARAELMEPTKFKTRIKTITSQLNNMVLKRELTKWTKI